MKRIMTKTMTMITRKEEDETETKLGHKDDPETQLVTTTSERGTRVTEWREY